MKKPSKKTFSAFRYIGRGNAREIFAVRWIVVSEISKVLLNDVFAELDGSRKCLIANRTIYLQKLHQSGKSSFK